MAYRKIQPTMLHNGFHFCADGAVLVCKNDMVQAILPIEDAGIGVEKIEGILCPGFVNAHCHLELSYLKNKIAPLTGMVDFLIAVMQSKPAESDALQQAIQDAENDMLQNGIVAVGDVCNTTHTIEQKRKGNLYYQSFVEVSGFVPQTAQQRLDAGKAVCNEFVQNNLLATLVPHAPYSVSKPLFDLIYDEHNLLSTIHYKESKAELDWMRNACGGLQKLYDTFAINVADWQPEVNQNYVLSSGKQLLVHSVYCNEDDHTMLAADTNKYVCLCPNANIFIGNDLPNVYALAKYNKQICLGTDSYASNNNLSIVEEIKTLRHFFPKLGLETLLRWATSNGADALGISNLYGSLEAGMPAKYVVLDKSLAQYST